MNPSDKFFINHALKIKILQRVNFFSHKFEINSFGRFCLTQSEKIVCFVLHSDIIQIYFGILVVDLCFYRCCH